VDQNGLGKDMWTLHPHNIEQLLFLYYLGELFYVAAESTVKLSLCFMLVRVFRKTHTETACYVVMALIVGYGLAFGLAAAFQCQPVAFTWMQLNEGYAGRCNNVNVQSWCTAIFNIALDVAVLLLPLRELWKLRMNAKKKVMLMGMFCLGFATTIVSIVRLSSLISIANSENISWDYMEGAYMSTLEMDMGIITACLPAVRTFFIHAGVKFLTTGTNIDPTKVGYSAGSRLGSKSANTTLVSPVAKDDGDFIPLVDVEDGKGGFPKSPSRTTLGSDGEKGKDMGIGHHIHEIPRR
jgi:hypothetical protein